MRRMPIVRQALLGLTIPALLAGIVIYPQTASAISLKESSVVTGNMIRVNDIFEGVSKDNDKILGLSPLPGREMVLDSRTLLRIALALDLGWRPESETDHVTVKRAATLVGQEMVESALKTSIAEKNIIGDYRLSLNENPDLVLPQDMAPAVEVTYMNVKPESGWFEATLAAPSREKPMTTARITGRIEKIAKIPVLRENMNHGTIIGAHDIDWLEIPERAVKSGMALGENDLVGMTPRRSLVSNHPVLTGDIEAPQLVDRGEIVTMVFNEGGLQLTAQGKALEKGAKGDRIKVVNTSSSKTVVAEVTNDKEVTLTTF